MLSRLMTRREQLVLVSVAAAILFGAIVLYATRSTRSGAGDVTIEPAPSSDTRTVQPEGARPSVQAGKAAQPPPVIESRPEIIVSVVGEVFHPGVYTLEEGRRVQDLIRVGGGLRANADTSDLNLAARLVDGTTLIVARKPPSSSSEEWPEDDRPQAGPTRNPPFYTLSGAAAPAGVTAAATQGRAAGPLINLNRASQAELETLPGIGPKLAAEIIRYRQERPFGNVNDMMEVSGIGPKRCEAVRNLVTVY